MTIEEIMAELADIERLAKETKGESAIVDLVIRSASGQSTVCIWVGSDDGHIYVLDRNPKSALSDLRAKLADDDALRAAEVARLKARLAELGEA